MPNYGSLEEFMDGLERYHSDSSDGWTEYKNRFFSLNRAERAIELDSYDRLLENEHRITKQHAEFITRRRELKDLDEILKRAKKNELQRYANTRAAADRFRRPIEYPNLGIV